MAKRKRLKPIANVFVLLLLLGLSTFFVYNVGSEITETKKLKQSLQASQKEQEKLKDDKKALEVKKENLSNVDYILRYARGQYKASKNNGEQIFSLPQEDTDE